jgi:transposase
MKNTYKPNPRIKALETRRLKAASYFKQGKSQIWVAKHFNVSRPTVHDWYWKWRKKGMESLKATKPSGVSPRLEKAKLKKVERVLLKGPEKAGYPTPLWTLPRIAEVIKKETRVSYHPGHVSKILNALGWSSQKPVRRARERDEKAIIDWKKHTWPTILKKGPVWVQP